MSPARLTKNWRYPGWRVTWTLGSRSIIESVASAGSFLDGGGSKPLQRAAIALLEEEHVRAETEAIARAFSVKRSVLVERLQALGVRIDLAPEGTFYVWGDLSGLPGKLSDGKDFFRAALDQKVIVVPGEFFDVNPGVNGYVKPHIFGRQTEGRLRSNIASTWVPATS